MKISTEISAMAVGEAIDRLREKTFKVEHRELWEMLGVQERRYRRWIAGGSVPTGDAIIKLLLACPNEHAIGDFLSDIRTRSESARAPAPRGMDLKIEQLPVKIPPRKPGRQH